MHCIFRFSLLSISLLLAVSPGSRAQQRDEGRQFYDEHQHLIGLYRMESETLVVGMFASADILYIQRLSTGDMRFLAPDGDNAFRYSPTRNSTDLTEGRIEFLFSSEGLSRGLLWTDEHGREHEVARVMGTSENIRFENGREATLHGSLIRPLGDGPFAAAVLIPQSDRSDLWDVGMWLVDRGIAVLFYDQRNNSYGLSHGEAVRGRYQDQQQVYAGDAIAAVRFLRSRSDIDSSRVGVVGWSGGGFTGAMVASEVTDLRFYVNIAGDASPGFEQASHLFVSRLLREGFSDEDVEAGRRFVESHFGVAGGDVEWRDYQAAVARVENTDWYRYLSGRYAIPHTQEEGILDIGHYQREWPPERVYGSLSSVPTLGVFFEFDHSSGPSSPDHFYRSLRSAGNADFAVVMIPDAHHGGFHVGEMGYRFDTSKLTKRSPLLIRTVAEWVERHTDVSE